MASKVAAGIDLPQAGPAASAEATSDNAELAESLVFQDVWVSSI